MIDCVSDSLGSAGGGCYDSTDHFCVEIFSVWNGTQILAASQVRFAGPRDIAIKVNDGLLRLARCTFSAQGYDVGGQGGTVYADVPPDEFPEANLHSAGLGKAPPGLFPSSTDVDFVELQVCFCV